LSLTVLRTAVPLVTATIVLTAGVGTSAAAAETAPDLADNATIVLDDGTVIGPNDSIEFTFEGERPKPQDGVQAMACPEVNNPPTYTVKGTPNFIEDKDEPKSTWLLPRQTVSWAVTGSHTFTWDIGVGTEFEAKIIVAKAKVKIDTKISNSWTWSGTQTVTDNNTTTKSYRAVLGQVGWKLTTTKTWIAPPCTVKTKSVPDIKAPRKGDMSIGRLNS
jgi:hypothetical protein